MKLMFSNATNEKYRAFNYLKCRLYTTVDILNIVNIFLALKVNKSIDAVIDMKYKL